VFYSRLEVRTVLKDLIASIEAEQRRNGAYEEEHIRDYLKAVLSDEGKEDQ